MSGLVEKDILAALDAIIASGEKQSLIATDRVQGLVLRDGNIGFSIEVDGLAPETLDGLKASRASRAKISRCRLCYLHFDGPSRARKKRPA